MNQLERTLKAIDTLYAEWLNNPESSILSTAAIVELKIWADNQRKGNHGQRT